MSAADIKKVKMNVEILHSEKLKLEKANAKKPAGKGKGKVTLRTENDVSVSIAAVRDQRMNLFNPLFCRTLTVTKSTEMTSPKTMTTSCE